MLSLCMSSHDETCQAAVEILFSMIYAEYILDGKFDTIETEVFSKLDKLVSLSLCHVCYPCTDMCSLPTTMSLPPSRPHALGLSLSFVTYSRLALLSMTISIRKSASSWKRSSCSLHSSITSANCPARPNGVRSVPRQHIRCSDLSGG